jgi:hypothetical protein
MNTSADAVSWSIAQFTDPPVPTASEGGVSRYGQSSGSEYGRLTNCADGTLYSHIDYYYWQCVKLVAATGVDFVKKDINRGFVAIFHGRPRNS